jgi:hypothetical protein
MHLALKHRVHSALSLIARHTAPPIMSYQEDKPVANSSLRGGCLCGKVRFTTDCLPQEICNCHCERCREGTALPFVAWARFSWREVHLSWDPQTNSPVATHHSDIGVREFCKGCGMDVIMKYHCSDATLSVAVRCFEESLQALLPKPCEHIFVVDKANWWNFPSDDTLPKWQQFDQPFQQKLQDWQTMGCPRRSDVGDKE